MTEPDEHIEKELIRRIIQGEKELFRHFADSYRKVSYNLALGIVKDYSIAEDVVQEAFLQAYLNLDSFRFSSRFSTWLYRIVINKSYSVIRKVSREDHLLSLPEMPSREEGMDRSERTYWIRRVLDRMKNREALVLGLFYLGEQRIADIAAITNMTEGHVKTTLHRARNNFRDGLRQLLGHETNQLL